MPLHLDRKHGEKIILEIDGHEPIEITVSRFRREHIKVSIEAPQEVRIHRAELDHKKSA